VGGWLSPTYRAIFADPVRTGHLKVAGLDAPPWVLSVVGIVALAALSVSLLVADGYRQGRLLDLGSGDQGGFLPASALPVVLVGLGLAWVLLLVGGTRSRWPLRLLTLLAFLLINAPISKPPILTGLGSDLAIRLGPTTALLAYWAVAGIVVLSMVLDRWDASRRAGRWAIPLLVGVAVIAFYGSLLWVNGAAERNDLPVYIPNLVDHSVSQVQSLLIPMVMLGAIGAVAFAYAVADGVAAPLWTAGRRAVAILLAGLVAGKLWIQVYRHAGDLVDSVAERPSSALFTVLMLVVLLVAVALLRRLPGDPEHASAATERLMYTAAFVLAAPALLSMFVVATQSLLLTQFGWLEGGKALLKFPFLAWLEWGDVVFWVPVLGVGMWLVRSSRPLSRELGGGLVLVAVWELSWAVTSAVGVFPGFDAALLDVLVTIVVVGYAAIRWRTVTAGELVFLIGVVVFSWLVANQGDWIALVASPLGLASIVVLLTGLVWNLVAGSGFTWNDGRTFRRPSRPLVWLGYLLLSLTLLHWFEVTHGVDVTAPAGSRAFIEIGIPIAAWLVARRPFSPPSVVEPVIRPDAGPWTADEPVAAAAPAGVAPSQGEPPSQGADGPRTP
jgi:hypothetical protein